MLSTVLSLASLAAAAGAASYSPFLIDPLTTHQPNGNPDGQVNYYHITFTVDSLNGGNSSADCTASWGDNSWTQSEAYSVSVPTGSWIACTGQSDSDQYAFQLFPYFSIGNFSLAVQQNFTDSTGTLITATGSTHVTNTTSQYTCTINPEEVEYEQHAQGDCSIPSNASAISIPVTTATPANTCTNPINATFVAAYPTKWGQDILLIGSIEELGSWDLSKAISMVGSMPNPAPAWAVFTAYVDIPPATDFEYKFVFRNTTGVETWETGDNRQGSTSAYSCGDVIIGRDPDDVTL